MFTLFHLFKKPRFVTLSCLVSLLLPVVPGVRAEASSHAPAQTEMNSAPAAAPRNNAATAKGNLAKMDAALQLSDAQKAAILPILQKLQDELSTLRDSGAGRGADAGQTFTNTAINQVRAELTAVQAQSFDNMREPRRAELFRF